MSNEEAMSGRPHIAWTLNSDILTSGKVNGFSIPFILNYEWLRILWEFER